MISNKDIITENGIRASLPEDLKSLPIFVFNEIDSTNEEAKRQIIAGNVTKGLFITGHQTHGKGRTGRSFYSPTTGIYLSYVFTPDTIENAANITTKAGVCVHEAVKELYGIDTKLKWVNDVYLNDRKICGILAEAVTTGINRGSIVVGIGINYSDSDAPDDIKNIFGFLPDRENVTRNALAASVVKRLAHESEDLCDNSYLKVFREASLLTGKNITYYEKEVQCHAKVLGIDDDAGLIVAFPDGSQKILRNGEVTLLREEKEQ